MTVRPVDVRPSPPPGNSPQAAAARLLMGALEKSAPWILAHSFSVAEICWTLGDAAGRTAGDPDRIWLAGLLHDIGKIGVDRAILDKPARLAAHEYVQVQEHCYLGYLTLERLLDDWTLAAASLHHHEHFDGGGYPSALRGTAIPLSARLVALADCYDAIRAERPYAGLKDHAAALAEIRAGAGRQFDPELVELFLAVADQVEASFEQAHGLSERSVLAATRDRLLAA